MTPETCNSAAEHPVYRPIVWPSWLQVLLGGRTLYEATSRLHAGPGRLFDHVSVDEKDRLITEPYGDRVAITRLAERFAEHYKLEFRVCPSARRPRATRILFWPLTKLSGSGDGDLCVPTF